MDDRMDDKIDDKMDDKMDLTKPHISRAEIETILGGMKPKKIENYRRALVHRSLVKNIKDTLDEGNSVCSYLIDGDKPASNERLEYLGDAVFNLIVGFYLFNKYPDKDEGFLTRLRTKIVRGTHCVKFSRLIGLDSYVLTGPIVKKNEDGCVNDKLLEDAFEAFLGAIFLDLGFKFSNDFIVKLIEKHVNFNSLLTDDNYKDILMRYTQNKGIGLPEYEVISEEGPRHKKLFIVQVNINIDNREYKMGKGKASNKREAEQLAAMNTLTQIDEKDIKHLSNRDII